MYSINPLCIVVWHNNYVHSHKCQSTVLYLWTAVWAVWMVFLSYPCWGFLTYFVVCCCYIVVGMCVGQPLYVLCQTVPFPHCHTLTWQNGAIVLPDRSASIHLTYMQRAVGRCESALHSGGNLWSVKWLWSACVQYGHSQWVHWLKE